jgi:hypothetical protein
MLDHAAKECQRDEGPNPPPSIEPPTSNQANQRPEPKSSDKVDTMLTLSEHTPQLPSDPPRVLWPAPRSDAANAATALWADPIGGQAEKVIAASSADAMARDHLHVQ